MEIPIGIASGVLLTVLIWGMFVTVFSGHGAGPGSKNCYRLTWRGLLAMHERWPMDRLLSLAGRFMLVATCLHCYVMLAVALFLALAALARSISSGNGVV